MKIEKQQLNYRFHNPNSEETTCEVILSVFFEVNKKKADEAIRKELCKRDAFRADNQE